MKWLIALFLLVSFSAQAVEWTVESAEGDLFTSGTFNVFLEFDGNKLTLVSDNVLADGDEVAQEPIPLTNLSATSTPVISVSRRQMFGLLDRIYNMANSQSNTKKSTNALINLQDEAPEVNQEVEALRSILRLCK